MMIGGVHVEKEAHCSCTKPCSRRFPTDCAASTRCAASMLSQQPIDVPMVAVYVLLRCRGKRMRARISPPLASLALVFFRAALERVWQHICVVWHARSYTKHPYATSSNELSKWQQPAAKQPPDLPAFRATPWHRPCLDAHCSADGHCWNPHHKYVQL